jgi:outer membrane lipoprotein-sorting protein
MRRPLAIAVLLVALPVASLPALPARVAAEAPPPAAPSDVPPCPSGAEKPDVAALVRRTDKLLNGRSFVGTMTMAIKTPSWSRKLTFKVWTQGKDYALIRVLEGGPRETGMMTLKREKQLWNWLPQAGRVMKLPSGMMGDSWMGSDFTNDDLVKGSSWVDDFDAEVKGTLELDGRGAWQVVLTPKPKAVVVWGRIEMLLDRQTCQPLAQHFYDEDGKLVRKMTFGEFRQIGWRIFPARMTVVPAEPGRETSISYGELEFDAAVPDDTFSLDRLRKGR